MLLRNRIVIGACCALAALGVSLTALSEYSRQEGATRLANNVLESDATLWREIVRTRLAQMKINTRSLSRNRDALAALQEGKLEDVQDELQPTFNRLSAGKVIDRLRVIDKRGKLVFAEPELPEAKVSALLQSALSDGKVKTGVVQDGADLVVAVAIPLYSGGKLVGAGMLAQDLGAIAARMREAAEAHVIVVTPNGSVVAATQDKVPAGINLPAFASGDVSFTYVPDGEVMLAVTGVPVLSLNGTMIGSVITAKDQTQSYWAEQRIAYLFYAVVVLIATLAVGGLFLYLRRTMQPLRSIISSIMALAEGERDTTITGQERKDEIGEIARAVDVFKRNAIEMDRMEEQKVKEQQDAEREKKEAMDVLADDFEARVLSIVDFVSSQSTELRSTAESMSATAEETSRQAMSVAATSGQASANVQTVASATEEMSASVGEINRQVGDSVEIASRANDEAVRTNETVEGLAAAAEKIGEIVDLIREIAEQTNLLALNATIEAARAGEAGKGFAVVASEVKNLATQTAKATEDIAAQINEIQSVSADAVQAIGGISTTIGEITSIAQSISSAVEEQGAATRDITENTQQAAAGTQDVTSTIASVTQAASKTGATAQQVLGAAGELSKQSETLRSEVDGFLVMIRSN